MAFEPLRLALVSLVREFFTLKVGARLTAPCPATFGVLMKGYVVGDSRISSLFCISGYRRLSVTAHAAEFSFGIRGSRQFLEGNEFGLLDGDSKTFVG